jgi:hypothetical protein
VAKVSTTLPSGMQALLDQCINRRLYGGEAETVRHFINAGLERLVDQGRLIDTPTIAPASEATDGEDTETKDG